MDRSEFADWTKGSGLELTAPQLDAFERFAEALYAANVVTNLTRVERGQVWLRHFADSVLFQDFIGQNNSVLDIGTGPGFPAWPLACARPDLKITALDSNAKMLGFLSTLPLVNLKVVNARAEEWHKRESFNFVTGRAVAPLSAQLEISAAFCKIGGLLVPMRAASDAEMIGKVNLLPLGLRFSKTVERALLGTVEKRLFPVFEKVQATKAGYPRQWAELKRNPL